MSVPNAKPQHNTIKERIIRALREDARLWHAAEGAEAEINHTLLFALLDRVDERVIGLLLREPPLKAIFFVQIGDALVFKRDEFRFFLEEHRIGTSYTAYRNRIGLTDGRRFVRDTNDVVLSFPYKDCVLEGGQSTEEGHDIYYEYDEDGVHAGGYTRKTAKRSEVFFNQVLAYEEIDRLHEPKALVRWKRYTQRGTEKIQQLARDRHGTITENLIIKGNNYLALHSLKEQFAGKVKLIYIDPPYNTGNDGFRYNDNFNHSTWLVFMKNRLEVARQLLRDDGVIFVQCDDNEQAYLKVLMDEVFGRENFVNNIAVSMKETAGASGGGEDKKFKKNIEYLIVFSKNKEYFRYNKSVKIFKEIDLTKFAYTKVLLSKNPTRVIEESSGVLKHYQYDITSVAKLAQRDKMTLIATYAKYFDNIFRTSNSQTSIRTKVNNLIGDYNKKLYSYTYVPKTGKNKNVATEVFYFNGDQILFVNENHTIVKNRIIKKEAVGNLWDDIKTTGLNSEGKITYNNGKKPEKLLKRIVELITSEGDIVLDYHLGSGTTAAVAHKMGRQYIGIEQMDYIEDIAVERLKKVIDGEQGGVSKSVGWQGGGAFVYCELAKWNEAAKERIIACNSTDELRAFFDEMCERYFLDYNVKTKEFRNSVAQEQEFAALSLEQQKAICIDMLDNNQLYVHYTEMADVKYAVSNDEQSLTRGFYGKK